MAVKMNRLNSPLKLATMLDSKVNTRTLGVLGGGQLGRMFCHAAQQLGFRTVVLDADPSSPAGTIAHQHIQTGYLDETGLAQLAASCDAITTEFENVPAQALEALSKERPVHPSHTAVRVCQDRSLEKQWFADCGIACAPNATIAIESDCSAVAVSLFPAILKTAQMGYDGKGPGERLPSQPICWQRGKA